MPLSTDINLPKSQVPIFPSRCVACGKPEPGDVVRVCTNSIGWWTVAFWTFGRRYCVDVPACRSCREGMIRQRWVRRAVTWGMIVVGVAVAGFVLAAYEGPFKRWFAIGIALVCLLPMIVWEMLFPPVMDLTAYSKTVDYEFRDAQYGIEFAALNQGQTEEGAA